MDDGIRSLLTLVAGMRTMSAESGTPHVILSGTGIEVRFAEEMGQTAGSAEWFNRIDKELKELRDGNANLARTVAELEGKLRTQSDAMETLRAAVEQNEQMMETLVDSMNLVDDLDDAGTGPAFIIPPGTRSS